MEKNITSFNGNFDSNLEVDESSLSEVNAYKFKNLGKEFFQIDLDEQPDFLKIIKESSRFYSFKLPDEISEQFIRFEEAPLFWLSRSPIILQLEDIYKTSSVHSTSQSAYKSIKEFYTKWIIIKSENEKRYFAASALSLAEKKSSRNNFLYLMIQSVILAFDKILFNPVKSIELLELSKEVINENKLDDNLRNELLYLINLYSGFVYLIQKDIQKSKNSFLQALAVKPLGISAKFYLTLSEVQIGQSIIKYEMLGELYNYDISRIEYSIEENDLALFEHLLKNTITSNLFYYPEFSLSFLIISDYLKDAKSQNAFDIKSIKIKLNSFKALNLNEYYNEKILKDISFLDKIIQNYSSNNNILLLGSTNKLYQKYKQVAETVANAIKLKYYNQANERLLIFDRQIQDRYSEIQDLSKEQEEHKKKLKERLDSTIKVIVKRAEDNVAVLEERIKNLQLIQSLNPRTAFRNAMTYNFILSVTVFLMGGCAGYSNNITNNPEKMNDIIPLIVMTGLKWGVLAFTVGLLISLISAGMALLESSNQKQRLIRAIGAIKDEKDYQVDYMKKEYERSDKDHEERFNKLIEDKKKHLNDIKSEREAQEKIYKTDAEQKYQEETKKIFELLQV